MKNVYKSLNEQKLYYEQELIRKKNVLKDTKEERKNITIKKIHGELYYYAQCKRAGKVNSQYLGPVIPGTIADIEEKLDVKMPEFYYRPYGMEYMRYEIETEPDVARVEYEYNDNIILVYVNKQNEGTASNISSLNGNEKVVDKISNHGTEIVVKEMKDEKDKISTYIASWEKDDVAYYIVGKIEFDEIKKIVEYMKF